MTKEKRKTKSDISLRSVFSVTSTLACTVIYCIREHIYLCCLKITGQQYSSHPVFILTLIN